MGMDRRDVVALALAARHDPAIRDLPECRQAETLLRADPRLRAEYESEARYYDEHQDLLAAVRLPLEAKLRMRDAIRAAMVENVAGSPPASASWIAQIPRWLALAAALLVLMGGILLSMPPALPTMADLRAFAAQEVRSGFALEKRSAQTGELVDWLTAQGMDVGDLGPEFLSMESMGCTLYGWKRTQVALICFRTANQRTVHLFFAPSGTIRNVGNLPEYQTVADRETRAWTDDAHAYVLVAHDPGQPLQRS